MDVPNAVGSLIDYIFKWAMPFATAMAAVGVISMAIIQTVKDTLPLRNKFQRSRLKEWLRIKSNDARANVDQGSVWLKDLNFLDKEIIRLATDGDDKAFYDLAIEQMCGQMNAAVQVALDYPWMHEALIRTLASQASRQDLEQLLRPPEVVRVPRTALSGDALQQFDSYVDARNRVTHQVQRAIDGFQISTSFRWKLGLQLASLLLSAIITGLAVARFSGAQDPEKAVGLTLFAALLGGFLAPVARDIVAALQQLRK